MRNILDADVFQHEINELNNWSNAWLLSFNTSKCHVLHFGSHAAIAASSAIQTLGTTKGTISSHSPGVMTTLYKALVQPKLEIGMTLASPFYKKENFILEAVQRGATKLIRKSQTVPYCEHLVASNYQA